jgi:hypothetical protein
LQWVWSCVRDWTLVKCCGRLFYMLPENRAEFYQHAAAAIAAASQSYLGKRSVAAGGGGGRARAAGLMMPD